MTPTDTDYAGQPVDTAIDPRFFDLGYTKQPDEVRPERGAKPRPTPARYFLKAGRVHDVRVSPARDGVSDDGRPWSFPARLEAILPLTIVTDADGSDEFAGFALNAYYRLSTEPVKRGKNVMNYSTFTSALDAFGVPVPESGDRDEIEAALASLEGLTSTRPVYVSYAGTAKAGKKYGKPFVKMPDESFLRFNEKAFRTGDRTISLAKYKAAGGTWVPFGALLDADNDPARTWTVEPVSENVSHERVYANVEPTEDGFRP